MQLPTGSAKITSGSCALRRGRSDKVREAAAETASNDLFSVYAGFSCKPRIHQRAALIVGDQRDALAAVFSRAAAASSRVVFPAPRKPPTSSRRPGVAGHHGSCSQHELVAFASVHDRSRKAKVTACRHSQFVVHRLLSRSWPTISRPRLRRQPTPRERQGSFPASTER